jgi:hypothetical protein
LTGTRLTAVTAKERPRTKTVKLAGQTMMLATGARRTLHLALGATGRQLLARGPRLPVRLTVTLARTGAKPLTVATAKATLRRPAPAHRARAARRT